LKLFEFDKTHFEIEVEHFIIVVLNGSTGDALVVLKKHYSQLVSKFSTTQVANLVPLYFSEDSKKLKGA
jgi:hypothetical protein